MRLVGRNGGSKIKLEVTRICENHLSVPATNNFHFYLLECPQSYLVHGINYVGSTRHRVNLKYHLNVTYQTVQNALVNNSSRLRNDTAADIAVTGIFFGLIFFFLPLNNCWVKLSSNRRRFGTDLFYQTEVNRYDHSSNGIPILDF